MYFNKYVSRDNLLLIIILCIGIFLRFYNFPHQYVFDPDAIRDAIVAYQGATTHFYPQVGSFSSTGPYTFGPWYYIGIITADIIFPSPYTPWVSMGIASLFTIFFMYKIGELLASKKLGILLAFLTCIAPSEIIAGTGLSNIYPVPLFTIISLWLTVKLVKTKKPNYLVYLLLGVSLGLGINAHYQMLGLLFLPLFLWIYKGWKNYKIFLLIGLGLFITFIPLLLFNLHMNWHTLRGIQEMYLSRGRIYVPNSWKIYLLHFWPNLISYIFGTPYIASILIILGIMFIFCWQTIKKQLQPGLVLITLALLFNIIWLRFYWGQRFFAYLYYLEPILLIFTGYMIYSLRKIKYGIILSIIFFLSIGISSLIGDTHRPSMPDPLSESVRNETYLLRKAYPNQHIILYTCNSKPDIQAQSVAYLLEFDKVENSSTKNIAILDNNKCIFPKVAGYNKLYATSSATVSRRAFPSINDTPFVDFSAATASAIKKASWKVVSTHSVFKKTVQWY